MSIEVLIGVLALCIAVGIFYVIFALARVGRPTRGPRIDRSARPNTALIVIDVQEDFTRNTGKHAYNGQATETALSEINKAVFEARSVGTPVAFIKNVFRDMPVILAMKMTAGGMGTPGREGLRLDRALDVGTAPTFEKSIGDSFSNRELEAWLEENRVGQLVLVGLDACHCVQLTAKGALARGYEVEIREAGTLTNTLEKWRDLRSELVGLGVQVA